MQTLNQPSGKLPERVLNYIKRNALIKAGDCIVVAVSGGADSVCLIHVLNELRRSLEIRLHIAHLNHGLRGNEGQDDANYVKKLASDLGLPITIGKINAHSWQTRKHTSLEEAAREARYRFFARVVTKVGATAVSVGHTLDDHVETVFLHLIRGTALAGLQGLRPHTVLTFAPGTHLQVIRPLLSITREETTTYCLEHNLNARTDASNVDQRYLRNRIRLKLLPLLKQVNPEVNNTIARLAEAAFEAYSFLHSQAEAVWVKTACVDRRLVTLNKQLILSEPRAIQSELVRMAITQLLGETRDFTARHFEAIRNLFSSPAGRTLGLPHQIQAVTYHDSIVLRTEAANDCPFPAFKKTEQLRIPGITTIPGWQITATMSTKERCSNQDPWTAVFDLDLTGDNLSVSTRQPGDRFQPLGMSQFKKLQDFMVDACIPRAWRDYVPLIRAKNNIIWVTGYRIDHRFRITPATKKFLTIRFRRNKRI